MKKNYYPIAILLFAVTITLSACSTSRMQKSQEVQSTMQSVDNDIKLIIVQLVAIGASLDELTKPGQADVKKALNVYSDNVSKIEKMEKTFSKDADKMDKSGKAYFESWHKEKNQYDNSEIQQRSDERRAALGKIYDRIAQNNVGVKEAFRIYVSDVNEINSFISNDLTSKGISSIASLSDKTVENGRQLKSALSDLQSAIEDARAEMTQSGISIN